MGWIIAGVLALWGMAERRLRRVAERQKDDAIRTLLRVQVYDQAERKRLKGKNTTH